MNQVLKQIIESEVVTSEDGTQLKVRKMTGVPESRIFGYKKVKSNYHNWNWFEDF